MPSKTVTREQCSKRGLILTCYVDGKKRFKATVLTPDNNSQESVQASQHARPR